MKRINFVFVLYIFLVLGTFFVWSSFQVVRGENIFVDSDQDGLSNEEERLYKTNPNEKDTDGDSYTDGVEVKSGYDPLRPAPGDKLFATAGENKTADGSVDTSNLTQAFSQEVASIITEKGASGEEISLDDLDEKINKILNGNNKSVSLPDVDLVGLKIKNPIADSLGAEEKKQKEREQSVKYLTAMAYIFAQNAPQQFSNENELASSTQLISGQVSNFFATGTGEILTTLAENGRTVLSESKEVEVPHHLLPLHIKAMQLAEYSIALEDKVKPNNGDPLAQIESMVEIQSLIGAYISYANELQSNLTEYGVSTVDIEL
jgi:hypothetical protein